MRGILSLTYKTGHICFDVVFLLVLRPIFIFKKFTKKWW